MRIALALMLAMTAGCTSKSKCELATKVSGVISAEIAVTMACKNKDAIQADIQKVFENAKLCEPQASGQIGEVICPLVITGLITGALKTIPAKWECSGGVAKDGLGAALLEICKKTI